MRFERDNRLGWLRLRELAQDRLSPLAAITPARVEPDPRCEVRPAVPPAFLDEVQVVEVAYDLAHAAIAHAVINGAKVPCCRPLQPQFGADLSLPCKDARGISDDPPGSMSRISSYLRYPAWRPNTCCTSPSRALVPNWARPPAS